MTRVIKEKFSIVILVRTFLIAIFIISTLYIYFLASTIQSAVESRNNVINIQIVSREYQKIENQYFNLLGKINVDYARQIGFVDQLQKVDYVVRQDAVAYGRGF